MYLFPEDNNKFRSYDQRQSFWIELWNSKFPISYESNLFYFVRRTDNCQLLQLLRNATRNCYQQATISRSLSFQMVPSGENDRTNNRIATERRCAITSYLYNKDYLAIILGAYVLIHKTTRAKKMRNNVCLLSEIEQRLWRAIFLVQVAQKFYFNKVYIFL